MRNAKRRNRQPIELTDYVLTQPPLYTGPRRPIDPQAPGPPPSERPPIPVVADFLQAAAEQYGFVPQRPPSDLDFKRAYARAARAVGLTREQIVGVYAFETGGRGAYDTQAGLEPPGPGKHAVSPAIGYNQLLSTNSVSILAEHGGRVLAALRQKAKTLNGEAQTGDGTQDRGAQAHDRVQPQRAEQLERARSLGQDHHGRLGHSRRHSRYRYRPAAAGAEAARTRCSSRAPRATWRRSPRPNWN